MAKDIPINERLRQQGHVLFYQLDEMPERVKGTRPEKVGRKIDVSVGETGGIHSVVLDEAAPPDAKIAMYQQGDHMILSVPVDAKVVHSKGDHGDFTLPAGIYEVSDVQEVDPFTGFSRNVAD